MQQLPWPFFVDDEIKKILKYDELAAILLLDTFPLRYRVLKRYNSNSEGSN